MTRAVSVASLVVLLSVLLSLGGSVAHKAHQTTEEMVNALVNAPERLVEAAPAYSCNKDIYINGNGTIPTTCAVGTVATLPDLADCYAKCGTHDGHATTNAGSTCTTACPAHSSSAGGSCIYMLSPTNESEPLCGNQHCSAGFSQALCMCSMAHKTYPNGAAHAVGCDPKSADPNYVAGLCYPKCKVGYYAMLIECVQTVCPKAFPVATTFSCSATGHVPPTLHAVLPTCPLF